MEFTNEELEEFNNEAEELLQQAEDALLLVEKGGDFKSNYNSIFRSFHSLKGASGMLKLTELQGHMHKIEHLFQGFKDQSQMDPQITTFFLGSIDAARDLLKSKPIQFEYNLPGKVETKPLSASAPPPTPTLSSKPQPLEAGRNKNLIFVIDDEEDLVDILTQMVSKYSLECAGYTDPRKAMQELKDKNPSMILTDMNMPHITGMDVLKLAKKFNSEIPVIFISGYLDKAVLMEALNIGVAGVVEKPFKEAQVMTLVNNALKERRMWQVLNKTIDLLLFKFPDLESYLKSNGKTEIANMFKEDVEALLKTRREIKESSSKSDK